MESLLDLAEILRAQAWFAARTARLLQSGATFLTQLDRPLAHRLDRLIKQLRRQNIGSYEAANQFLRETYLPEHNQGYGRPAASEEDFHRRKPSLRWLEEVFCLEAQRALSHDWVVRYRGGLLQIQRYSYHHAPAQAKVIVREWESGKLEIRYRGVKIAWKEIPALPQRPFPKRQLRERLRPVRPSAPHPWRGDYRDLPTPRYSAQW